MAEPGRPRPRLRLCRACRRFVRWDGRDDCVFCGEDLAAAEARHEENLAGMRRAAEALRDAMARVGEA